MGDMLKNNKLKNLKIFFMILLVEKLLNLTIRFFHIKKRTHFYSGSDYSCMVHQFALNTGIFKRFLYSYFVDKINKMQFLVLFKGR